jgi:hypothetical protein
MKNKTVHWMVSIAAGVLLCGQVLAQADIGGPGQYHFYVNKPIPSFDLKLNDNFGTNILKATTAIPSEFTLSEKTNPPTMGGSSAGDVNGTFVPSTRYIDLQLLTTNPPTMGGSSAGDVNGTFVPSTRHNVSQLFATNPPTMGGSSAGDVNGTFVPSTRHNVSQLLATNPPTMGGSSAGDVNGTFVPSTRFHEVTATT